MLYANINGVSKSLMGGGSNALLLGEIQSKSLTNSESITFNGNTIFIAFSYTDIGDAYKYNSLSNFYIYDTKNNLLFCNDSSPSIQDLSTNSSINLSVSHYVDRNGNTTVEYQNIGTISNKTFTASKIYGKYTTIYYMTLN